MSKIISSEKVFSTNWFDLVARKVAGQDLPYYCLELSDYVSVLALTPDRKLLMVTQYRPAVGRFTLEFPSGHVDEGETPEGAAVRELVEETGYEAQDIECIACLSPDTGRLANRLWCYFVPLALKSTTSAVEDGIRLVELHVDELICKLQNGEFDHALNIVVLFLAILKNRIPASILPPVGAMFESYDGRLNIEGKK